MDIIQSLKNIIGEYIGGFSYYLKCRDKAFNYYESSTSNSSTSNSFIQAKTNSGNDIIVSTKIPVFTVVNNSDSVINLNNFDVFKSNSEDIKYKITVNNYDSNEFKYLDYVSCYNDENGFELVSNIKFIDENAKPTNMVELNIKNLTGYGYYNLKIFVYDKTGNNSSSNTYIFGKC